MLDTSRMRRPDERAELRREGAVSGSISAVSLVGGVLLILYGLEEWQAYGWLAVLLGGYCVWQARRIWRKNTR